MVQENENAAGVTARPRPRGLAGAIWSLEHAQDYVAVLVGLILVVLAVTVAISASVDFIHGLMHGPAPDAVVAFLGQVLLLLILAEILHTVVLSLRQHRLVAQPFIVVGLVAVIRKILFVLSGGKPPSDAQFGLLIAMLAAFVAGLIAVSWFERHTD